MSDHTHHGGPGAGDGGAAARWDERYAASGYVFGVEPNRFVAEAVAGLVPGRAVDLACGEGRNAVWLAARGWAVTAVDLSAVALDKARRLAADAGVTVEFVHADLGEWAPAAGGFDLVVLSYLHLPAPARETVHAAAVRALAPGGTVVVVAHHRDNLEHGTGGPQDPAVLYDEGTLRRDFAALDVVRCDRVLRPVETDAGTTDAIDLVLVASAR